MKKTTIILATVILMIICLTSPSFAVGSGAFRIDTADSEALGKGLAFVAEADNPSAVYYNPAGLTQLKGATHASLGYAIVQPFFDHEDDTGTTTQMRRQTFLIPHLYYVNDFGMDKVVFGLGAGSGWGLGTYWATDSFSKYVMTKADIQMKDMMLTGAYEFNDQWSLGVAFDYNDALINKKKKLAQTGGADGDFQMKMKDITFGYRLSTLLKLTEKHQFGLQYRSEIKKKYQGKAYLDGLTTNGLNYRTIFGDATYETRISVESTLPQSILMGYNYIHNEKLSFNLDVEWMDWSSLEQERIVFEDETDPTRLAVLNDGNPIDRDWKGTMAIGTGMEYKWNDRLRLRGGYFFHQTPIPEPTLDSSLPDSNSHSVTVGCGYDVIESATIDLAYSAMFYQERDVHNNVGASAGATIDGKYKTFVNIFMATINYKF